ncbi:MAG TPA: hypothetical protein VKS01_02590 [Bryobacteraceae bacterium]|nr:hypothetical protein [Bryobacteraceae bacterium]
MTFEDYKVTRRGIDEFATIHSEIAKPSDLFEALEAFRDPRWAFRGQGEDWQLKPTIDRHAIRPGIAEDFLMREFRRRAHHYLAARGETGCFQAAPKII